MSQANKEQPVEERRIEKRRHLIYYFRVFDAQTGAWLGQVADLTLSGVMLYLTAPAKPGQQYRFRVRLDSELVDADTLEVEACCVWTREDTSSRIHEAGFRFMDLDTRSEIIIEQVLHELGFRD